MKGAKRTIICNYCGNEKIIKNNETTKYCCKECYWKDKNKKASIKCKNCDNVIDSSGKIFCSKKCQGEYTTKNTIPLSKIIICKHCGNEKEVLNWSKVKFCSIECTTLYKQSENNVLRKRKNIICKQCGKKTEVLQKSNADYCSLNCYWEFRRENPDVKIQSNQYVVLYDKICENCGEKYSVHNYRLDSSRFCSQNCFDNFRRETLNCPTCKTDFKVPLYQHKKYCSNDCAVKGNEKRKSKFSNSLENFFKKQLYNYIVEYKVKSDTRKIYVDFIINNKFIIECYGDYWHCNPNKFDSLYYHSQIQKTANEIWEYDKDRINFIFEQTGIIPIIIWESDWNKDKNKIFEKLKKIIDNGI